MNDKNKYITKKNRIYFLDNLRTFMVFLVVVIHSGGVYESSGVWAFFWIVDDYSTNDLVGKVNMVIDICVMSTIFFVSGYFTPSSLQSKSSWMFIKTKFKRLIIPWIFAVLTLIPLYKFIFLYSRNIPQESWTTYFHFTNSIFSQNWLWFLPVLFLFDMLFLGLSKLKLKLPDVSLKTAVALVFVMGLTSSFLMDLLYLQGWTKTTLLDFQNERLFMYFLIFLLGGLCYKLKTFDSTPKSKIPYIVVLCLAWVPISLYHVFYIQSFVFPGIYIYSEITDKMLMWLTFHLSLFSLLYVMVNIFRHFLNTQGSILRLLSRNSYNVYIIHTIVLGAIATIMLNITIPSLLKFFLLVVSTFVVSNIIVFLYRKFIKTRIIKKGI